MEGHPIGWLVIEIGFPLVVIESHALEEPVDRAPHQSVVANGALVPQPMVAVQSLHDPCVATRFPPRFLALACLQGCEVAHLLDAPSACVRGAACESEAASDRGRGDTGRPHSE